MIALSPFYLCCSSSHSGYSDTPWPESVSARGRSICARRQIHSRLATRDAIYDDDCTFNPARDGGESKRRHDLHFSPPPPPTAECHAAHAVMDTAPVFKVPSQDSEA